LELDGVDSRDLVIPAMLRRFRERGHGVYTAPGPLCWQVHLPETWDEFLRSLVKRKRQHLRRCVDRYLKPGRVTMHAPQDRTELRDAFEIFRDLHQRRRQSLGDPGCFGDPAFAGFLEEVAERFFDCGMLDLLWAKMDGQPIAAGLNLVGSGVSYGYQSGINPDFLEHSPGKLITIVRMQRAIQRGDKIYDFMQGNEPYKKDWHATPAATYQFRIIANRPMERLRHQGWLGNRWTRRLVKRGLLASRAYGNSLLNCLGRCAAAVGRLGSEKTFEAKG
jgi:CelD/BcsL family acetyltransferase involved in cellulose biosynthesis